METIFYLLRVSACITGFYLVYLAIFRNITAFKLNRYFLLAGLITSFIIPSLDLSVVPPDYHVDGAVLLSSLSADKPPAFSSEPSAVTNVKSFATIPLLYWFGVLVCSTRLFFGLARIIRLKAQSKISTRGSIKIFRSDIEQPFTFFNSIFLPHREIDKAIIEHEKSHVVGHHWFDLLVTEIAAIFLWFNPVMILYRRSLRIQHEYEADEAVLSKGVQIENYLDCMLRQLQMKNASGLTSTFYSNNIKQRILMMTRNRSTRSFKLLYLLFVPVVFGLLAAFSSAPVKTDEMVYAMTPVDPDDWVLLIDPGHGGSDVGGHSQQTNEKDLALSIARSIQVAGEKRGVKVVLTRTGDQAVSLEERVLMAERFKADIFLSIHVNNDPANVANSGIDIMVSDRNPQFEKSNGIAEQLKKELGMLGGPKVKGIQNSNFFVLSRNSIPATLIELGYLSNQADHAYLSDEKNHQAVSERIMNAVVASVK